MTISEHIVSQLVTILGFPGHFAKFPDLMKIRAVVPSILQMV